MSKTLPVLIKVAERRVETIQQALAHTRAAIAAVHADMDNCERAAKDAFMDAVGEDDVLALQAASAFQERMRRQLLELKAMLADLESVQDQQRAQLQEAFAEQKRYEILLEQQRIKAKKEHDKKVQNALDDMAQKR